MAKTVYLPFYVVHCTSMTGAQGQPLFKGKAYAPAAFLNIDDHIAAGHIVDKDTHDREEKARMDKEKSDIAKLEEEQSN